MTTILPADRAYTVVSALSALGGKASLKPVHLKADISKTTATAYLREAISRGWVEQSGVPRTPSVRYALTHEGRAEVRRREPKNTITLPLGSGGGYAASDADLQAITVHPQTANAGQPSLRSRLIAAICEEQEWGSVLSLMQQVRQGPRDTFGQHEVMHILYELNRQGLITYVESRNGSQKTLSKIKATRRLLEQEKVDLTSREVKNSIPTRSAGVPLRPHDATDYRTHGYRAEGGPIERMHVAPPAPEPVVIPMATVATATFPTIASILDRKAQITEAARLLDLAGKTDLALAALETIDTLTDLEKEAVTLYELAKAKGIIGRPEEG